jgi:hypothetical protein
MMKVELQLTWDGRLLLVEHFAEDTNVRVNPDRTCTRVPKEREIELLKKAYEAIDNYNKEQMFRQNMKP